MYTVNAALRSCFTCDNFGNITFVIVDDLQILARKNLPTPFHSLFSSNYQEEARNFWQEFKGATSIFERRININSYFNFRNTKITAVETGGNIVIFISYDAEDRESVAPDPKGPMIIDSLVEDEKDFYESELVKKNLLIESLTRRLESNDQKFRILSAAINDAIRDWNIFHDSITWNQRVSAIYGYSENETPVNFESWVLNIHEDDRKEVEKMLKDTLRQLKLNWKSLYRFKCANGTYKYTFDRGYIVYENNTPVRMISVMEDVNERMISLREIEKLSMVASKTDNLVIITDAEERIEWVNEGFIKKTGYTLSEVIGATPRILQGPKTNREALNVLHDSIKGGKSVTQEVLNYTKTGEEFWLRVNINPVFDERDVLTKFVAVETDITMQKEYERKISSIASDLTNLITTLNAPIFGVDRNGNVNEWNELAAELTGYTKQEMFGRNLVHTLIEEDLQSDIVNKISDVFKGEPFSSLELPIVTKSKKKIIILLNGTLRKNSWDNQESVFLVGHDISELTQYRLGLEEKVRERTEELQQALDKERELVTIKTRFASMVSHEFRTPLSTIKLSANHIKRYRSRLQPSEIDNKLDVIQTQVLHMTHMLEDVLKIGKSEEGKLELHKVPINIKELLMSIKEQVESQFAGSHVISCSFDFEFSTINSDSDLFRNIFINLFSNAIKFSPGKHEVFFRGRSDKHFAIFEVEDQGIGIPEQDRARVFTPFDRGTNASTIPGTGLGLSIVKKAVELMNGSIVFSDSRTGGTIFSITIPLKELSPQ